MSKGFITNLCSKRPPHSDQSISVQESVQSTICCSRPVSMQSANRIPCSKHQMIHVYHVPSTQKKSLSSVKTRTRSKSPSRSSQRNRKSVTFPDQNWATVFRTNSIFHNCSDMGDNQQIVDVSYTEPKKTCSCVSSPGQPSDRGCSIKSRSRLQVSNSSPAHHVGQRSCYAPEELTGLKNDIENVKNQLEQIKKPASAAGKAEPELMTQLKLENKHLKRELELKKKLYSATIQDVERAKDILSDYEKKVVVLHEQAMKSSKIMKQSKEKFCKCVKQKELMIKELKESNANLLHSIREKEIEYVELNKTFESLQNVLQENSEHHANNNHNFSEAIKTLQKQLEMSQNESRHYKDEMKKLEEQSINFKCKVCDKLEAKVKKQKDKFESRIREREQKEQLLNSRISELSAQVEVANEQKVSFEQLQNKYDELQVKIEQYETLTSRYNFLEEKYQQQCYLAVEKERDYERDRDELKKLVDELTDVVKQNKVTLLQLSDMNKQQEALIASQSAILIDKDEKIKMAQSEIDMLRAKSSQLEEEIEDLRRALDGPCSKNACLSLSRELEEMRIALNIERDDKLVKEKIIEDQSRTISDLQIQMKDKLRELSAAREESDVAEKEILKINDDLIWKHRELERELQEKEHLMSKLKSLEQQKSELSKEMSDLEILLQDYCNDDSSDWDENQRRAISDIKREVAEQRLEWETQKVLLSDEKERAINAAKFATQKLLDTVSDFQKQVDAQKKVQVMLTKMLHDKETELKLVQLKMSSINSIAADKEMNYPLNEIYKRNRSFDLSNPTTTTSFYSSNSNSSKCKSTCPNTDLVQLFQMLTKTELPMKDA